MVLPAEINDTNWTKLGLPWYLMSKMDNNGQSGLVFVTPYYCGQGLFAPSSFLSFHLNGILNGILAVIVVAIGRISLNPETG